MGMLTVSRNNNTANSMVSTGLSATTIAALPAGTVWSASMKNTVSVLCFSASADRLVRVVMAVSFPVKFAGAHDRVRCVECHTKGRELQGMAQQCIACHQQNDVYHNSLGPNCADCHSQQTFTAARFRHDRVGCSLRGVHRVLPCVDCHKGVAHRLPNVEQSIGAEKGGATQEIFHPAPLVPEK